MSWVEALILGIVQGLTEFLPVSSSGHLKLFQMLFGYENLDSYVAFDLACHLGTLLTICIVFMDQIRDLLKGDLKKIFLLFIATLPLVPLYLFRDELGAIIDSPQLLGYFFLTTGFLLFLGDRLAKLATEERSMRRGMLDSIIIGLFQAIAILPGISRSGSTISAARALG